MAQNEEATFSRGYLRYAMGLFLVIYVINFVDRQIFSILIEPIKAEIELSDTQRLVDLPGYGYAKVPVAVKKEWTRQLEHYLQNRQSLRGLILLMDVRHPMQPFDQQMLTWALEASMPVHILLTKADKLKRGPANNTLLKLRSDEAAVVLIRGTPPIFRKYSPSCSCRTNASPSGEMLVARVVVGFTDGSKPWHRPNQKDNPGSKTGSTNERHPRSCR